MRSYIEMENHINQAVKEIIFFEGGWGGGVGTPLKNNFKTIPEPNEKLHCKGEPYQFSAYRAPSLQTYIQKL